MLTKLVSIKYLQSAVPFLSEVYAILEADIDKSTLETANFEDFINARKTEFRYISKGQN
ncbi:hypothetical protein [Sulfurimonas sp.]|uniref:hypothetical protein n=1 Tax=Sulfurimonas sp. TaxID=2022749 RepID=UPI00286E5886|nr:hypothetical protein [Sulfurimonas sp.]